MQPLLQIEHLSKQFPGQLALDDVDFELFAGRTHALVGQNGSGKSTLIKILAGYHQPTGPYAARWYGGGAERLLTLGDARSAEQAGIRFVHQDLGLVPYMSAVENIALGTGYTTGFAKRIHWKTDTKRAESALARLGFDDFDVRRPIATLAASQKTAVAIARALQGWEDNAALLVLDEPTASLPGADVERLFEAIRRLKARGVAILYVSHHLDEVFAIADEVTILRDGKKVITEPIDKLDHGRLIELMIGHRLTVGAQTTPVPQGAAVGLEVRNLAGGNVQRLSVQVRAGEIVGVAGITGSGREHVIALVSGQMPSTAGDVDVKGALVPPYAPHKAKAAGLASVPGDRLTQGILPLMSVTQNLTLSDVARHAKGGRLRHRAETGEALSWIDRLKVRTASHQVPISTLSGGNQQKVLFARSLRMDPVVLTLDEPTRGVDVGAKEEIHQLVDTAAQQGAAVLVASTDTEEIVRLAHRVLIMRGGTVAAELTGDQINVPTIEHAQLQTKEEEAQ